MKEIGPYVRRIRWAIHRHPELSLHETQTAALVESELRTFGLEVRRVAGTGVVGLLRGAKPGRTVALRADMDALPVQEKTGCVSSSTVDGVMHACGHDAHTAILLGAARILSSMKREISGNVKFLFQPAEEDNPVGGAKLLIQAGALEDPKVDMIFALHVWPDLATGKVGIRPGPIMAASDRVTLRVLGKSSHGSLPHQGVDAVVAACQIVVALQTITSRNLNPLESAVLTFGTITGGTRYNILANETTLEGTVRTFSTEARDMVEARLNQLAPKVAEGLGAVCEVDYIRGYPAVVNHPTAVDVLRAAGEDTVGREGVVLPEYPSMVAEDFAFYLEKVPGALFWLGCTAEGEVKKSLHSPEFLPDENCLGIGVEMMVRTALRCLEISQNV